MTRTLASISEMTPPPKHKHSSPPPFLVSVLATLPAVASAHGAPERKSRIPQGVKITVDTNQLSHRAPSKLGQFDNT